MFTPGDLERFAPHVDRFSLMTYDYTTSGLPGPNAPIEWVRDAATKLIGSAPTATRRKVLLGLAFYGNDWPVGGGAPATALGRDVVARLQDRANRHAHFTWQPNTAEHLLEYTDAHGVDHVAYVPTKPSVAARARLAQEIGVGISIWEIGQGMNCFFDAF